MFIIRLQLTLLNHKTIAWTSWRTKRHKHIRDKEEMTVLLKKRNVTVLHKIAFHRFLGCSLFLCFRSRVSQFFRVDILPISRRWLIQSMSSTLLLLETELAASQESPPAATSNFNARPSPLGPLLNLPVISFICSWLLQAWLLKSVQKCHRCNIEGTVIKNSEENGASSDLKQDFFSAVRASSQWPLVNFTFVCVFSRTLRRESLH